MTRRTDRTGYAEDVRLGLLENDADYLQDELLAGETRILAATQQAQTAVREEVHELRKNLVSMQRILVGLLVSLATASVLLAINLGIAGAR
jgi:Mg2+ and Co2+ transporter CorA